MDVNEETKINFEIDPRSEELRRETAIMDHNACVLCGTDLKFDHQFDYVLLRVTENAHCPCCRIQLRSKDHGLH